MNKLLIIVFLGLVASQVIADSTTVANTQKWRVAPFSAIDSSDNDATLDISREVVGGAIGYFDNGTNATSTIILLSPRKTGSNVKFVERRLTLSSSGSFSKQEKLNVESKQVSAKYADVPAQVKINQEKIHFASSVVSQVQLFSGVIGTDEFLTESLYNSSATAELKVHCLFNATYPAVAYSVQDGSLTQVLVSNDVSSIAVVNFTTGPVNKTLAEVAISEPTTTTDPETKVATTIAKSFVVTECRNETNHTFEVVCGSTTAGVACYYAVTTGVDFTTFNITYTNTTTVVPAKTEDTKTEDTKTEDTKTEDTKTEDTKTEDTKTEDTKTEDTKTEDTKTEDTKTEDTKTEDTKTVETSRRLLADEPTITTDSKNQTYPNSTFYYETSIWFVSLNHLGQANSTVSTNLTALGNATNVTVVSGLHFITVNDTPALVYKVVSTDGKVVVVNATIGSNNNATTLVESKSHTNVTIESVETFLNGTGSVVFYRFEDVETVNKNTTFTTEYATYSSNFTSNNTAKLLTNNTFFRTFQSNHSELFAVYGVANGSDLNNTASVFVGKIFDNTFASSLQTVFGIAVVFVAAIFAL